VRRAAAAVLVLVLATTLAGCGDPQKTYCDALRADQVKIDDIINSRSGGALLTGLPVLTGLADKAPDDLTDEWQTFVNAVEGLRDALKAAGVSASAFTGGRIPASVTGEKRQNIVAAADTLSSDDVVNAVTGIESQARDVCKVNLGL
jgi:hypothetical protein